MSGLQKGSVHQDRLVHPNLSLTADEQIFRLKNLNDKLLKIIIDIDAFLELVDIRRLDMESDLAGHLLEQGIKLESFKDPEKFFDYLELEKRNLQDCIIKNTLDIKTLQRAEKHKRKAVLPDLRLFSPLTEEQFMMILNKFASIGLIDSVEIEVVRILIKCSNSTTPFDPEAFSNTKIKLKTKNKGIQLTVIWDFLITREYIKVDELRRFESINDYFRNENNLPFKGPRKSFNNYGRNHKKYPELELIFRAIQRELSPGK